MVDPIVLAETPNQPDTQQEKSGKNNKLKSFLPANFNMIFMQELFSDPSKTSQNMVRNPGNLPGMKPSGNSNPNKQKTESPKPFTNSNTNHLYKHDGKIFPQPQTLSDLNSPKQLNSQVNVLKFLQKPHEQNSSKITVKNMYNPYFNIQQSFPSNNISEADKFPAFLVNKITNMIQKYPKNLVNLNLKLQIDNLGKMNISIYKTNRSSNINIRTASTTLQKILREYKTQIEENLRDKGVEVTNLNIL